MAAAAGVLLGLLIAKK
nr:hypothetical protein [Turicimonas muris]